MSRVVYILVLDFPSLPDAEIMIIPYASDEARQRGRVAYTAHFGVHVLFTEIDAELRG